GAVPVAPWFPTPAASRSAPPAASACRHVQARHADPAGGADRLDDGVEHHGGLFLALGGPVGLRLVADRVNTLVGALSVGLVLDLRDRVPLAEVRSEERRVGKS